MSSRVQLSISCKNLINMDVGSLSDPFVVVKTRGSRDAPWQEVARTEIIANNLNPQVRHCTT
jgi:C2 domain